MISKHKSNFLYKCASDKKKKCNFAAKFKTIKIENIMAYKITDACIACGTCIDECPVGAISEGDIYKIDADSCIDCGACASVCPSDAIVS